MTNIAAEKTFEQKNIFYSKNSVAEISLQLGAVAMQFARVDRAPRYEDGQKESDVEHSFMLALVAPELAQTLELPLNLGMISQFAMVHDLIELKTMDVPTFTLDADALRTKEQNEHAALEALLLELPPFTAAFLARYEKQEEPEARFVKLVDKLLPKVVDILGQGKRVVEEDYGITTQAQLSIAHVNFKQKLHSKFGDEFCAVLSGYDELAKLFEQQFKD